MPGRRWIGGVTRRRRRERQPGIARVGALRAALGRRWVLNEKGLVRASGLGDLGDALAFAGDAASLASALLAIEREAVRE